MAETGKLATLFAELQAGKISRRSFLQRSAALGMATPIALFLLNGVPNLAAAQATQGRPASGTENQKRGEGGELKILQWQAPTVLTVHNATGSKDTEACALFMEPLMCYLPDGSTWPTLVKEVPSEQNGLLAKDLTSVTYNLLEGVTWSDGKPLTADDVVFTWQWIMNKDNQSVSYEVYRPIKNVEALSGTQVKVTFNEPRLDWYVPFSGYGSGAILPKHLLEGGKAAAQTYAKNPVGSGPFVVTSFKANDQVLYAANEKYREPNKPYFAKVNLKGGGDAVSAARAVLQTGDWDFGWNIQVEPEVIKNFEKGGKGKVYAPPGTSIEHLRFNFSDPNKEAHGQRSYWKQPHPFFTDKAVRQALSLATDNEKIANEFYMPPGDRATSNILNGLPKYESHNTKHVFDMDQAKKTLDDAGWVEKDGVRQKDGIKLQFSYETTINSVRQKTQAVIKKAWDEIGAKVQLKQVDSGVFFDTGAGNDQGYHHFFTDLEMYTATQGTPFPLPFVQQWYSGNGQNIAQKENGWSLSNTQRYTNPDFDKLYESASSEKDPEKFAQLIIQMNDIVVNDFVVVPLVNRSAGSYAISNELNNDNVAPSGVEPNYWNIVNWNKAKK